MYGSQIRERSREVGHEVAELCSGLDPNTVPLTDVPATFDELVAMRKRLDGAIVRMTARYEEAGRWKRSGAKDFEDDLARNTGESKDRAKRRARTSRRLKHRPKTDAALRDGQLSMEQADAVSSGADASPEDEDALLESAGRDPLHELKRQAARARARADNDREARARRQHALRSVRRWIDDEDGLYNLLLRITPDHGAEIDAFLKPLIDRMYADARDQGRFDTYEAYAADVITDLLAGLWAGPTAPGQSPAESTATPASEASDTEPTVASDTEPAATGDDPDQPGDTINPDQTTSHPRSPGDPNSGVGNDGSGACDRAATADREPVGTDADPPAKADPPEPEDGDDERLPLRARKQAVRPDAKVIGLIDVAALNRGTVEDGETCEIAGVGDVPVAAIRALLSDAHLAIVIKDGVDILNVTHLGRQVTAHQRTALEARGYQCEIEGCGATHHLEIDHVTGWTLTQETRLDDLGWLCRPEHRLKTRHNMILTGPPGQRQLIPRPQHQTDHTDSDPDQHGGRLRPPEQGADTSEDPHQPTTANRLNGQDPTPPPEPDGQYRLAV